MSVCRPHRAVIRGLAKHLCTARSCQIARTLSTDVAPESGQSFALTDDQSGFKAVADDFAARELLPFAAKWDAEKYFPVKTLVKAAELGFGGILVAEDVGEEDTKLYKCQRLLHKCKMSLPR